MRLDSWLDTFGVVGVRLWVDRRSWGILAALMAVLVGFCDMLPIAHGSGGRVFILSIAGLSLSFTAATVTGYGLPGRGERGFACCFIVLVPVSRLRASVVCEAAGQSFHTGLGS